MLERGKEEDKVLSLVYYRKKEGSNVFDLMVWFIYGEVVWNEKVGRWIDIKVYDFYIFFLISRGRYFMIMERRF